MVRVGEDKENVLQEGKVEGCVKAVRQLRVRLCHVLQQAQADEQPSVGDFAVRVLEGPDDAVHKELEEIRLQAQQRLEAARADGLQQGEEGDAMLGELGKVLVDHLQRGLKDGVEDGRDVLSDERLLERDDDAGGESEDFGLASLGGVLLVVQQDGFEQVRHKGVAELGRGVVLLDGGRSERHQPQDFLLDTSHASYNLRLCRNNT